MKILVLAQYFPPDITAAAFRIYDTVKLLEEQGHEVCVITAMPHKVQAEGDSVDKFDSQLSKVRRAKLLPIGSGGMKMYLKHYLSFMFGCTWQGIKQRISGWKPDVIWASSPTLFVGLSGRFLSFIFRRPLVLDVRDIWPDSAVGAGQISQDGKAFKIGKKIEKYVYKKAKHITCVARPMRDYIVSQTNTPVSVIYNGVMGKVKIEENLSVNNRVNEQNKKTILYAGNLGRVQQLDLIIRAWAKLSDKEEMQDWKVRFIGGGAMEKDLKNLISELGLDGKVVIDPPVSREIAERELRSADILYISLQPDEVFRKTIPSKVFDCMLAGRPVIAGIWGEGKEILETTGANLCYEPGDINSLKSCLLAAVMNYDKNNKKAALNSKLVLRKYTREIGVETLVKIFSDLNRKV